MFCDALDRIDIIDESAIDVAAIGFVGTAAAVPTVLAARHGAAAQAHGALRQHARRMRSRALMSMRAAAAGMSVGARLAIWPLDTGRRTPLASIRHRHTGTRPALRDAERDRTMHPYAPIHGSLARHV